MVGPGRDPRQLAVLADPDGTVFAERPARELAERDSPSRVAPPLAVDLDARRRTRAAFRELERRGFVAG